MTEKILSHLGNRYHRLTVIEICSRDKVSGKRFRQKCICLCDCGKEKKLILERVRDGRTKSCGCLRSEITIKRNILCTQGLRHGKNRRSGRTSEYACWAHMKERCSNPDCKAYKYYGERGITVCKRWETFENFFDEMGKKPYKNYSLDRINNDGNYEPGNCRWTDWVTQRNNQRKRNAAT